MKTLVIYDSAFGNTKKIAEAIAKTLDGEAKLVGDFQKSDLKGIELLVVGSPINGWMPLPSVMAFLNSFGSDDLKALKATAFDTRVKLFIHGDAKEKIAKNLERAGADIVIKPEAFYVKGKDGPLFDGELERASTWAKTLDEK
jgi:flavodoxin